MKIYAKCPPTECSYLTSGKEYEVFDGNGKVFAITDDEGEDIRVLWQDDGHAKGDWERIERDDATVDTPETLTARDRFALAVMAGIAANPSDFVLGKTAKQCAEMAYKAADAMMEARKK